MHGTPGPVTIDLTMLMRAYAIGIFPMADARDDVDVFWVEPEMRAILPLDSFHLSKSLKKVIRSDRFTVTCNRAFGEVIALCAESAGGREQTWINRTIEASFIALHNQGRAHSIECWQGGALVGGLYGVEIGRAFCGESMFSRATDASKVALAWLVASMRKGGLRLLDCQFITPHLKSLGAVEIPQADYLKLLGDAISESPFAPPRVQRPHPVMPGTYSVSVDGVVGAGADSGLVAGFSALAGADAAGLAAGAPSSSSGASSPGYSIAQFLTQTS
ncbi:leucyl/phenylalanyl-tRNA--protein transferase [Blastomonas fulva]|uniref:leucyl/phenylalanyl-tRNA--protein transferase n=1 Tax=Blastomonas fulva TaxID=1550728 RepID=UPI0025A3C659|nr:leucyl/phenylalanyl-tRNA--protein transferase [Blastomonas fulva]MDM7929120.1 leucyl/phenylalanyl-tRNA--protein transferase [Blastomonas fulva]MDM7966771.1 leucyl/phenylalanyl-tRNA--protein transferase [Blastomonas fulva]